MQIKTEFLDANKIDRKPFLLSFMLQINGKVVFKMWNSSYMNTRSILNNYFMKKHSHHLHSNLFYFLISSLSRTHRASVCRKTYLTLKLK